MQREIQEIKNKVHTILKQENNPYWVYENTFPVWNNNFYLRKHPYLIEPLQLIAKKYINYLQKEKQNGRYKTN